MTEKESGINRTPGFRLAVCPVNQTLIRYTRVDACSSWGQGCDGAA